MWVRIERAVIVLDITAEKSKRRGTRANVSSVAVKGFKVQGMGTLNPKPLNPKP